MNGELTRYGSVLLFGLLLAGCSESPAPVPTPPAVLILQVQPQNLKVYEELVATLDGSSNSDVRSQVSGYLLKQNYSSGATVKAGDILFEIDPRPYQTDLLKAQADLESAQAQQIKAQQDEDRNEQLIIANAVSKMDLQASQMANEAAKSQVKALEAVRDHAKLNLDFTSIAAPISGVAGSSGPSVGDLVTPTQNLTTISTIDPIDAKFTIGENFYLKNADRINDAMNRPVAERAEMFDLIRADGKVHPYRGKFDYIDRQVEASTGAIRVSVIFPNPDLVLRPGQFARIRFASDELPDALAIPQRAVRETQGRTMVAVVKDDNTIDWRPVELGPQVGNLWVIKNGLHAGERVVVEGIQKCQPGKPVQPASWTPDPVVTP